MSNPSLKEQLQSFSTVLPATVKTASHNNRGKADKQKAQKAAWLEYVKYGVELLKVYYPACFKDAEAIKPVKIGIKHDLLKDLSGREDIVVSDKACMVSSLAYYVNTIAYHRHMVAEANRIDLHGNAAGVVTAEEALYSKTAFQAKKQRRITHAPAAK